jgi:hypothetical protein
MVSPAGANSRASRSAGRSKTIPEICSTKKLRTPGGRQRVSLQGQILVERRNSLGDGG